MATEKTKLNLSKETLSRMGDIQLPPDTVALINTALTTALKNQTQHESTSKEIKTTLEGNSQKPTDGVGTTNTYAAAIASNPFERSTKLSRTPPSAEIEMIEDINTETATKLRKRTRMVHMRQSKKHSLEEEQKYSNRFSALQKMTEMEIHDADLEPDSNNEHEHDTDDSDVFESDAAHPPDKKKLELQQNSPLAIENPLELTRYVKGIDSNLIAIVYKNPILFQRNLEKEIGIPQHVKYIHDSQTIRITCQNHRQLTKLNGLTAIGNYQVKVTLPKKLTRESHQYVPAITRKQMERGTTNYKGLIFGIDTDIDLRDIIETTDAIEATRLRRNVSGNLVDTKTVLLTFEDSLPTHIYLGYTHIEVTPYVPNPMRCNNCQKFGHTLKNCRKTSPVCSFCAEGHSYEQCTNKTDQTKSFCANCHQNHSAAYRKCPRYLEVQLALRIRTTEKIPFKQALEIAKTADQKESTAIPETGTQQATSQVTNNPVSKLNLLNKETWPPLHTRKNRNTSRTNFASTSNQGQHNAQTAESETINQTNRQRIEKQSKIKLEDLDENLQAQIKKCTEWTNLTPDLQQILNSSIITDVNKTDQIRERLIVLEQNLNLYQKAFHQQTIYVSSFLFQIVCAMKGIKNKLKGEENDFEQLIDVLANEYKKFKEKSQTIQNPSE